MRWQNIFLIICAKELTYNYGSLTTGDLYPHTSVTAFVGYGDKKEKSAVCEGYAKAFKVLCDKVGIPCVLVSGQGVTSSGAGAHMWNYVQMEDKQWYLVDATWVDRTPLFITHIFWPGIVPKVLIRL